MRRYSAAVDIGGTFTDIIVTDNSTGESRIAKVSSTPGDLSRGVTAGLQQILASFDDIEFFAHGTTAGLNALLQRRGARSALVTTKGFRDVYEMGRGDRAEMYNLRYRRPERLVPRSHVFEVAQRTLADGSVPEPVDLDELAGLVDALRNGRFESIAVCFLHSYVNPSEEQRAVDFLQSQLPDVPVFASSTIANEWREYERTSTVVMNAYIAPIVENYLLHLERNLQANGLATPVHVMQSNGGVMTATAARQFPLGTLLSGPVGGAIGGQAIGQLVSTSNILTIDMGGTSFDVSIVVDGELEISTETEIEGFPLLTPVVNIHTIGAGGGSIAWSQGGGLRVGPQSAGAEPGPACYGRGGTEPTVTDANLILGRLSAEGFLGGDMRLDVEAAEAVHQGLAAEFGLSTIDLAEGIIDVVNTKMANAIRTLTVARGIDPRQFTLVAFGGAGPLHAAFLTEELEIPQFIVPSSPGIFSAWGMLQTDLRYDLVRSFYRAALGTTAAEIEQVFDELREAGTEALVEQGIEHDAIDHALLGDMRYIGQEYVVTIQLSDEQGKVPPIESLIETFHATYDRRYGHSIPYSDVEFVNLRVKSVGRLPRVSGQAGEAAVERGSASPVGHRPVRFAHEWVDTAIFQRENLQPGETFEGPAVVNEKSATTVVPPGYRTRVDQFGNLLVWRQS